MLRTIYLIVVIAFAFSCKSDNKETLNKKPSGPPPVFSAVVADTFTVNRDIESPGTILPNENADLHPEVSGRVISINFKEGSFVEKGRLLIKLFDGDLQAQLKKLLVQLKIGEATLGRQKELLAINGTSQQEFDDASLSTANIKADIELLRVSIEKTEILAPFSGKLGLRTISLGAYVTPQTTIANIAQVNLVKVEFSVPEKYATELAPGHLVQLHTDGNAKTYKATIVATQNDINSDNRSLTARALVSNADVGLTPGAFVQVTLGVGGNRPAVMLPTQAIIPSTRYKKVIVSRNGKATFQNVTTGFRDSARVEILSGLQIGDTVITTGLLTIKDKQPVKVKIQ